jgi:hypothetical protein
VPRSPVSIWCIILSVKIDDKKFWCPFINAEIAALIDAAYTGFLSISGLQTPHYSILDVKTGIFGATYQKSSPD